MGYFYNKLVAEKIDEAESGGRSDWVLHETLSFISNEYGRIDVPAGFRTDFASVPRAPLLWWLAGGCAEASAVVHDYLHRGLRPDINHEAAAAIFNEAMRAEGVPGWRRWLMYRAVWF